MTGLPTTQDTNRPYRIGMVCLGNICRSPMAQVVVTSALDDAGLDGEVEVDSCGTGGWHAGEPMDDRAAATLSAHGYDPTKHRAQQFTADWYANHDLLLTMDHDNYRDVVALAPTGEAAERVQMFRTYDPSGSDSDDEVPDPWYGGPAGFERVLTTIERTAKELVAQVQSRR